MSVEWLKLRLLNFAQVYYTYIKRVIGREEEIMWFKNENGDKDFLHPLFIDDLDVEGIKNTSLSRQVMKALY
ncbi:hypothetical protein TheetDRAFT_2811 [Thermoanaerobacter ethanolicus JW 200]|nr:hypothetical protein TheetDRAFT_2811 [Thermoanaerobacter ethanolicus JW 200]